MLRKESPKPQVKRIKTDEIKAGSEAACPVKERKTHPALFFAAQCKSAWRDIKRRLCRSLRRRGRMAERAESDDKCNL